MEGPWCRWSVKEGSQIVKEQTSKEDLKGHELRGGGRCCVGMQRVVNFAEV